MKFGIDVREACQKSKTGKGQWTYGFVSELLKRRIPVTLFTNTALPREWTGASVVDIPKKGLLWHWNVARYLRRTPLLYVSPTSFIVPFLTGKRAACIPIIHDLIAFRPDPHECKAKLIERCTLRRVVRSAAHICTISEATKRDLLHRYPAMPANKVSVIFAGPSTDEECENVPDGKTILCLGTLCPRKNQLRLTEAFARLPDRIRSGWQLILAGGRGWQDAEIVKRATETAGVRWVGYVADKEREALMSSCTIFAYPSLYEGFGIPVLDAMRMGIPILTSDKGSLAEVAGSAALMVDPQDPASIAQSLERLMTDSVLRETLKQKGREQARKFSWERTVDLFLEAMRQSAM